MFRIWCTLSRNMSTRSCPLSCFLMATSNILIWNARGLNDRARRDAVQKVVDASQPAIVCLQEAKLAYISEWDLMSILGRNYGSFVFLPAQRTRGGILVAWKNGTFTSDTHRVHLHSVSIQFRNGQDAPWWLTRVYGPHVDGEKQAFLDELREVRSHCHGPWVETGDFNMIYCSEDKNNDNINRAMMGYFCCFVNDMELKEIPLLGRRYTWSNKREAPTLVKLDRALCTTDWESLFPNCVLQSQATMISDHCPLILGLRDGSRGKKRFHFESFCTKLSGFHDIVAASWEETVNCPCPLQRVSIKLKLLAKALQSWSQRQVGHVQTQLALAREVLHRLEIAQDNRLLSTHKSWLKSELKRLCLTLSSLERTIARLRSRVR